MSPAWTGRYNQWSHRMGEAILFRMVHRAVDRTRRRELGWGPCPEPPIRTVHRRQLPILYPLSPTLLPPPSDWPAHSRMTGFWFLDADPSWQPPPALAAFLDAGPPPIYVGFGSMGDVAAPAVRQFLTVLTQRKQRAIVSLPTVLQREIDPASLPEHILPVEPLPHSWLFPRTAAVIHHGGIGTTAEALRAGVPMAIFHFSVEQAFWARLSQQLGVAPPVAGRQSATASGDRPLPGSPGPGLRAACLRRAGRIRRARRARSGASGHRTG